VHMIARAVGLKPDGLVARSASSIAWRLTRKRGALPA